jgi:propanol-preferring alcohol dehydrogenase
MLGSRAQMNEVLALAATGEVRTVIDAFPLADAESVLDRLAAGSLRSRAVLRA